MVAEAVPIAVTKLRERRPHFALEVRNQTMSLSGSLASKLKPIPALVHFITNDFSKRK